MGILPVVLRGRGREEIDKSRHVVGYRDDSIYIQRRNGRCLRWIARGLTAEGKPVTSDQIADELISASLAANYPEVVEAAIALEEKESGFQKVREQSERDAIASLRRSEKQ